MAYPINPPTNLRVTAQGRTFGIGIVDVGMGTQYGVFELIGSGWNAVWTTTPMFDADLSAEVNRMGGLVKWLDAMAVMINSKLRALFSAPAPLPTPSGSITAAIDADIRANWLLTVDADGVPVFRRK